MMQQRSLAEATADGAITVMMTRDEAETCVSAINEHAGELRRLVLDLHEREGWRALGYESWEECRDKRFPGQSRYIYYQLEAAQTERRLNPGSIGGIPEKHLRPLTYFRQQPEVQREAWQAIQDTAPPAGVTTRHSASVVQAVREQIAEGKDPHEAINHVVEQWRLPSPSEAKTLARETGLLVAGSDGMYHDASSPDQRQAIADDARLVDGRNRFAGCRLAGVEPRYTTLGEQDAVGFILSKNLARRHMSTGQRALAIVRAYRENSNIGILYGEGKEIARQFGVPASRIAEARTIEQFASALGDQVLDPAAKLTFHEAYEEAAELKAKQDGQAKRREARAAPVVRRHAPDRSRPVIHWAA